MKRLQNSSPFPTRRSSDLTGLAGSETYSRYALAPSAAAGAKARSEEHTSELKSHLKIVCRLLLEKKQIRSFAVSWLLNAILRIFAMSIITLKIKELRISVN